MGCDYGRAGLVRWVVSGLWIGLGSLAGMGRLVGGGWAHRLEPSGPCPEPIKCVTVGDSIFDSILHSIFVLGGLCKTTHKSPSAKIEYKIETSFVRVHCDCKSKAKLKAKLKAELKAKSKAKSKAKIEN